MTDLVILKKNRPTTTSLLVAEKFGKRHDTVLRKIRELEIPKDFALRNFAETSYLDQQGKEQPVIEMTRDGFTFLAMGFTGKKAAEWKIKYISAFNSMEEVLRRQANQSWQELRSQGKAARHELTDTVQDFIAYAEAQGSTKAEWYYTLISKATNKALFIIENRYGQTFRDMLTGMQLSFLQTSEFIAQNAIREGMEKSMPYKEIYVLARDKVAAFAETVGKTPVPMNQIEHREQLQLSLETMEPIHA